MSQTYKCNELKTQWKIIMHIALIFYILLCIVPLLLVLMVSLTDENTLAVTGYSFFPKVFSFEAYSYVLSEGVKLLNAYAVTTLVTIVGTFLGLLIIAMYSYAISRKDFRYNKFFTTFAVITMLFNGGLVPWYLICIQVLHIKDTVWALIIPYLVNAFYIIVLKSFFKSSIPDSIIESAKLDGAGEFRIFFSIITRISLPGFATVGLFLALGYWNDWWLPMMLIERREELVNLQFLLYRVQENLTFLSSGLVRSSNAVGSMSNLPTEGARMAMAVLATGPIVLVYPFIQKYFVKGLTLGAVKG